MGDPDSAQRESAKITADKKNGSARLLLVAISLVVIVAGVLWLSGLLSPGKFRETEQVALQKKDPVVHKKKIIQPVKVPTPPVPALEKETVSQPDARSVQKEYTNPLPQQQPETLSGGNPAIHRPPARNPI